MADVQNVKRCFGASQGQSWGQSLAGHASISTTERCDNQKLENVRVRIYKTKGINAFVERAYSP